MSLSVARTRTWTLWIGASHGDKGPRKLSGDGGEEERELTQALEHEREERVGTCFLG